MDRAEGEGVGACDEGLGGDDGGGGGEEDERERGPLRGHLEERGAGGVRVAEEESALAEVVEGEGWEDEVEPCAADGVWAEVAHVGVEGFAAGDGEEDAAEDDEAGVAAGG